MFNFINRMRERQQAAAKEAADLAADMSGQYHALIRKGVSAGKLSADEADTLAGLAMSLGHNAEQVEAHTAAVEEHKRLKPISDAAAAAQANYAAAETATRQHAVDTDEQVDALRTKRAAEHADLSVVLEQKKQAVKAAGAAVERVSQIEAKHWKLLGIKDPSIAARKAAALATAEPDPSYILWSSPEAVEKFHRDGNVKFFERLLPLSPHVAERAWLKGRRLVKHESQSQYEFETLVTAISQIDLVRFLCPRMKFYANRVIHIDRSLVIDPDEWLSRRNPSLFHFVPFPGQPKSEFEAILTSIENKHAEWCRQSGQPRPELTRLRNEVISQAGRLREPEGGKFTVNEVGPIVLPEVSPKPSEKKNVASAQGSSGSQPRPLSPSPQRAIPNHPVLNQQT